MNYNRQVKCDAKRGTKTKRKLKKLNDLLVEILKNRELVWEDAKKTKNKRELTNTTRVT